MKTSELIEALSAAGGAPVRSTPIATRLILAALVGATASAIVLAAWLGFQPIKPAMRTSWFWMKWGYGAAAALAGMAMAIPLSRPGGRIRLASLVLVVAALVAIGMMAMHSAMRTAPVDRLGLWLGHTWMVCPWRILALAAPIWLGAILVMRRLAPTRLGPAGAAAGLLAGGVSVMVYGLYCQETAAPFVATWYTLGIAVSAGIGWLLGPRLLRW